MYDVDNDGEEVILQENTRLVFIFKIQVARIREKYVYRTSQGLMIPKEIDTWEYDSIEEEVQH